MEVEHGYVEPVERALSGLAGVNRLWATAVEERAEVWVSTPPAAVERTAEAVEVALQELSSLPPDADLPVVTPVRTRGPTQVVVVSGDDPDVVDGIADELLQRVRSSTEAPPVQRRGRPRPLLAIRPVPELLGRIGLSLADVADAVKQSRPGGDGVATTDGPQTLDGLAEIIVQKAARAGAPIVVGDVARIERRRDSERAAAWVADRIAQVLLVQSEDVGALRQEVLGMQGASPPGVDISLLGTIEVRGCASSIPGGRVGGDLDIVTVDVPVGSRSRQAAEALVRRAAYGDDVVWIWGESVLGGESASGAPSLQVLIPRTSAHRDAILDLLAKTAELGAVRHDGDGRERIVVQLEYPELDTLAEASGELLEAVRSSGLQASTPPPPRRTIELEVDEAAAARMGLTIAGVAREVRLALRGETVSELQDGREPVELRLEPPMETGDAMPDPRALEQFSLQTSSGASVPLGTLVSLRISTEPVLITRRDMARVTDVYVSVATDGLTAARTAIQNQILPRLKKRRPDVRASLLR